MITRSLIKPRMYRDSVKLMSLSAAARSLPRITQAAAIMGTDRNKATLEMSGLLVQDAVTARPDDLVIVVQGEDDGAVEQAVARIEAMLAEESGGAALGQVEYHPRSLAGALRSRPQANLALVSVPGPYAAAEAIKALRAGLHVQIFSDNVSVEDEVEVKRLGRELGLLVMGPDCGTCIIGGVPLGFANVVARGPIGIVGASGTGIQEATVLIDRLGSGITHAIGTGGRDLADAVGGITAMMGLAALEEDPETRVILLISKPPGARTAEMVLQRAKACSTPVVVCFLNAGTTPDSGVIGAATLEEAAAKAVALARGQSPDSWESAFPRTDQDGLAGAEAARKKPGQRYVRGLYTGGTLADEAMHILEKALGGIYSNTPLRAELKLPSSQRSREHAVLDLGDDEFTRGRPHPMIDPSYRAERLIAEATDPEVAVILCDVVIGYGSHPDPAGVLAGAIKAARTRSGNHLTVVASVCGTSGDPQDLRRQEETLRREGVLVFPTNAYAAEVAGAIARRCAERGAN